MVSVLLALALTRHPEGYTCTVSTGSRSASLKVDWAFRVDTLSVTMMLVVSGVGTLIHIYAIGYMHRMCATTAIRAASAASSSISTCSSLR